MKHRVVVTGLGVLSACGAGWKVFWDACLRGESHLRALTRWGTNAYPFHVGGEVPDFDPRKYVQNRKNIKLMSRDIQFAVGASKLALDDAGIVPAGLEAARSGVVIGSGVINNELDELAAGYVKSVDGEGLFSLKKFGSEGVSALFPLWMLKYLPNMPASHVTIEFGLRGYSNTVTFSAASGAQAIAEAVRVIERGDADIMLAGGADSKLNPMGLSRFELCGMLSKSGTMRPFDAASDGMVVGEGAGVLVLESQAHALRRSAKIYAEVVGSASSSDTNASPQSHIDGSGKERAMRRAVKDAGIDFKDLDGVIANGSGLPMHDQLESQVLHRILDSQTSVVSLKPVIGHTIYAAGGIESAAACLAASQDDWPHHPQTMNHVMLNSFGFCGQNTALIFKKWRNP